MAQQQSPWLETAYGWAYGENGWNSGMDSNLLKFSVMFDRNVDSIVASLPAAVNGQVHYNTSDSRIYFAVGTTYFSTVVPKWFTFVVRSTGESWQFNGIALVAVESVSSLDTRLDSVELTLSTLGSAAFEDVSAFATQAALDVLGGQTQAYTDTLRSNLAESTGAALIGYGAGTVAGMLDTLSAGTTNNYLSVSSAASVTLDASVAGTFGVLLSSNISSLTLAGGASGKSVSIDVVFSQDATGGRSVTTPPNVRLPNGVSGLVSLGASEITLVRFTNVDNSSDWLYQRIAVFSTATASTLPTLTTENSTFNDEGTSTAEWTTTNATLTSTDGVLRHTHTSIGDASFSDKDLTFTPPNSDYILYGKVKVRATTSDSAVISLYDGVKETAIWFGLVPEAGGTPSVGSIYIVGTTGASTKHTATIATGVNYEDNYLEFALHYDHKFSTVTAWFREIDGRWKWKGRVASNWHSTPNIRLAIPSWSPVGAWVEFDYLMLARPNLAVISDSISAGATLFDPNPANGLSNDESTWMRHAVLYPALRNNLVVNKGVGSNTSAQILSRIADATGTGAKVVFLQASNNDEAASISLATRTSNIQSSINAIAAAGASTVLLNGLYGTSSVPDNTPNPDFRDYMRSWWDTNRLTLTDVSLSIDTMTPVRVAGDFVDPAKAQADGVHPNIAGHTSIGDYIETFN